MAVSTVSNSLIEMSYQTLVDDELKRGTSTTAAARKFGIAGRSNESELRQLNDSLLSSSEIINPQVPDKPHAINRMFDTTIGLEATSIIGNEERTLQAIKHVSAELIAAQLQASPQWNPSDRVLIGSVATQENIEKGPVAIVLTDRLDDISNGYVGSGELDITMLSLNNIASASSETLSREIIETPEARVFNHFLNSKNFISQLLHISRPEVVFLPKPKMIELCAPSPAIRINQGNRFSSVGVLCQDEQGTRGISACLHGTGEAGTTVEIEGHQCEVALHDAVNDIVFIPIKDALHELLSHNTKCNAGLRQEQDRSPAAQEPFLFDGVTNPDKNTIGQSCDPWLFNYNPSKQLRVQTTRDADEGDSGCALIDEQDKLVGFAFQNTAFGQRPEFTEWIWAPNALEPLGLHI